MATCPTCRTTYSEDHKVCPADGAALVPEQILPAEGDLVPGQTVGEYRVEAKLGEGGFGAVYRAVHPLIGKAAAIKVLNRQWSANPQMVSRFIAEARAVNQIKNRNIIDIFSFGALDDGRQYYVMELLDGSTLDAYVKQRGRLSPEEALPILRGVAKALDAAHGNGIAHRDLKPENIFLVFEDDGVVFPKLLDFGIAKLLGDSALSGSHKTRTGTPLGTPHYMSPEQCRGRNVDHRTDLYSFGVVLFEVLTGKVPFDGEDVMEILIKHTSAPAPRPSEVCPSLPPALDAPILAFLEKEPEKRPASIAAGLEAVAQAAADAGLDVHVSGPRKPIDPARGSGPQVRVGEVEDSARTELAEGKTILSAETMPSAGARRTALYGGVAAAAVVAAGAVFFATRGSPAQSGGEAPTPVTATGMATGAAAPVETAKASAAPAEPPPEVKPAVTAAPAADIELTFDSTPKDVEVYLGDDKIGTTAAPVKIKRAEGKVKLTLKAPGYLPREIDVPTGENAFIPVTLKRAGGGGAPPPAKKKSDLEF